GRVRRSDRTVARPQRAARARQVYPATKAHRESGVGLESSQPDPIVITRYLFGIGTSAQPAVNFSRLRLGASCAHGVTDRVVGRNPTSCEIVRVFASRLYYSSCWRKLFQPALRWPPRLLNSMGPFTIQPARRLQTRPFPCATSERTRCTTPPAMMWVSTSSPISPLATMS